MNDSIKTESVVLQENGIVRNEKGSIIGRLDRDGTMESQHGDIFLLKKKVKALQDFCIWMTGCGYDFTQHEYFCKTRDELLKGVNFTSDNSDSAKCQCLPSDIGDGWKYCPWCGKKPKW